MNSVTKLLLLLFFGVFKSVSPFSVLAQQEAAVWLSGTGYQLKFQSDSVFLQNFDGKWDATASICDADGDIILYSDGKTIWNGMHEMLVNGEKLHAENFHPLGRPEFIPWPEKEGRYLLIYESVFHLPGDGYRIEDRVIQYAEINVDAYNGKGEVVSKGNTFHKNYHASPTIAGYCNNSYYWLVIDRNDNVTGLKRDRIFAYKIDKNGINSTPVINDKYPFGNSYGYKFSPNGDKFYCSLNNSEYEDLKFIADFNFITGEIYNFRSLRLYPNRIPEFSSNSNLLYFFSGSKLIQAVLRSRNSLSSLSSYTIIHIFESNQNNLYPGQDLQLGPDGRIYFTYYDVSDEKMKLGRINKPNQQGLDCEMELDFITANVYWFPDFVTSFFRDKPLEVIDKIPALAGKDIKLCPKTSAKIGENTNPDAFYYWYPESNIDNPFIAQPNYSHTSDSDKPVTLSHVLMVTDGNCWMNFDTVNITQNPAPKVNFIEGSWSVCPYVEEVDYWSNDNKNEKYWMVDGGEIVSEEIPHRIKVNWWDTNADASVNVYSVNRYGCNSDTTNFPVRINVELITETPKGQDKLCLADGNNKVYRINYTNGSVYEWITEGGEILNGQGSNEIAVNWLTEGLHSLTVEETSTTIDTVCYGVSEPLWVEVINDSLDITLENLSFNLENKLEIFFYSEKLKPHKHTITVLAENEYKTEIRETDATVNNNGSPIHFTGVNVSSTETIWLKVINACDEIFYSNQLQTINLSAHDLKDQKVRLEWNHNQYWENNKVKYEVWKAAGNMNNFELIADDLEENSYDFINTGMEKMHYFRVKAINSDKNIVSWSNWIRIELDDALVIPDVFTPNGDGYNDVWEIQNIRFYDILRLTVYDRNGQKVYECRNHYIPWDGRSKGEIYQGTYLYELVFIDGKKKHGQLTILK